MKILHLIIAESSLETVPDEIVHHPVIRRDAMRRGKDPHKILLDRSRHHEAMKYLKDSHKRGRPDIVYLTLQVTQYTPLNSLGMLRTYVHTLNDYLIFIDPRTRVPHNYYNFVGLFEQLFEIGKVPPEGEPLIILKKGTLKDLVREINPDIAILLDDVKGREETFKNVINKILSYEKPCIIIGGFPHGAFREETYSIADDIVRVGKYRYTTFLITAKILTYLENKLGIEI
ncbi:MAG: ribosome biogenesis protein [Crenarchaeota archaeon]|nr:ribosome biogenesis protein [Thermoproteota archaeon]